MRKASRLVGKVIEVGDLEHENGIAGLVVEVGRDGLKAHGRNLAFQRVAVRVEQDDEALVKLARTALELALEWRMGSLCAFVDPSAVYANLRAEAVRLGVVPGVLDPASPRATPGQVAESEKTI
jgi:hypothetical protein